MKYWRKNIVRYSKYTEKKWSLVYDKKIIICKLINLKYYRNEYKFI